MVDPDKALDNILDCIEHIDCAIDVNEVASFAYGLVESFIGLNEWLKKGGFLPSDWAKAFPPD